MKERAGTALAFLLGAFSLAALLGSCANRESPPLKSGLAAGEETSRDAEVRVISLTCTGAGPELCFNALDDNCNGLLDEGCPVKSGLVQFVAAWDSVGADVDLNVVDPNGELAEEGRVTKAKLTKEQDCPGKANACQGHNMENVYLDGDELTLGKYVVSVRLQKRGRAAEPVRVVLGARLGNRSYARELSLREEEQEISLVFEL